MEEENDVRDTLAFTRIGKNGMQVEVKGNADTLRSMFRAALMEHPDMRKLLVPVFMDVMKDPKFIELGLEDLRRSLSRDEDDIELDTE
jgi:hypothetical protein